MNKILLISFIILLLYLFRGEACALSPFDQQTIKVLPASTSTIKGTVTVTSDRWYAGDINIGISTFNVSIILYATGTIQGTRFEGDGSNLTNIFQDRGDPSSFDLITSSFTRDGAWYDLDLSQYVPEGTKVIRFYVEFKSNTLEKFAKFRKNGNSNEFNIASCVAEELNRTLSRQLDVFCDTDRIIEYNVEPQISTLNMVIIGWIK